MKDAQTIGKVIYEKTAQTAGPGPGSAGPGGTDVGGAGPSGGAKDEDVIDAEYEVKK